MAGYGQEFTAPLPTVAGDIDVWGPIVNEVLQELVDTIEAAVTPAGMNINADVDCGGNKLDDVEAVGFDDASSQPAASAANQGILYPFEGELWYHDFSNRRIKITSNGILNASGNGDIGGDFGLGNEALTFNDTNNRYSFTEESGQHSEIEVAAVKLSRDGETNPNEVTLQPPAALAAAYALTMPAALPASTSLVTCTSGGVLSTSLTPSVTSLTASGALVAATATITDDDVLHGERSLMIPACMFVGIGGASGDALDDGDSAGAPVAHWEPNSANDKLMFPIPLCVGDRLKSVTVYLNDAAGGTGVGDIEIRLWKVTMGTPTEAQVGSQAASLGNNTTQTNITVSGLTETIADQCSYYGIAEFNSSSDAQVFGAKIVYDRVA